MVDKTTLIADIYKLVYSYINSGVTDPRGRSKWIFPTYPVNDIDNGKLDYPIIIIESPEELWEKLTLDKKWSVIEMDIEIYTTSSKENDEIVDQVRTAIESNWKNFLANKIDKVKFIEGFQDKFSRGQALGVHMKALTLSMRYSWVRT